MTVEISVVVPVYNPGPYIDRCIDSMLRQSLPVDEYEVIFVDDGSTDGTAERLDELAGDHANIRVIHIPNSGWPGRPRNIGIEAARGRYVQFVDNDDWLGDEALARLFAYAEQNGADVVVGKEVGHGKGVPRHLFRRNVADARFDNAPLLALLTPHKLFRRAFLDEHRIRFPEGRRRLEDHVFVMKSYFAAGRISILADYPCYHWVERHDTSNATNRYADPVGYYANVREVLDIVDAAVGAGPERERMYAHWYRSKGLDRLRGRGWATAPSRRQLAVFEEVRRLALERIGPDVDRHLPMKARLRSRAVREGRPDLVSAQARIEHGLAAEVVLSSLERDGERVRLSLSATLKDARGNPIRFRRRGDRLLWDPPAELRDAGIFTDDDLDATDDLARAGLALVLRQRDTNVEHDRPAAIERIVGDGDRPTIELQARAEIDHATIAAGGELAAGMWDLFANVHACGWRSVRRVADVAAVERLARPVHLHTTQFGNLSLRVADPDAPLQRPIGELEPAAERGLRRQRSLRARLAQLAAPLRRLVHLPVRRLRRRSRPALRPHAR